MTFDALLTKVRNMAQGYDATGRDFLAVQINIEPYEYIDRNCAITISMTNFNKLLDGKLDAVAAYSIGKLKVDGDLGKALEFSELIKKK